MSRHVNTELVHNGKMIDIVEDKSHDTFVFRRLVRISEIASIRCWQRQGEHVAWIWLKGSGDDAGVRVKFSSEALMTELLELIQKS